MALTYPKAPRVEVGGKVTSAKWNALAEAFNARERSGLGDFHWRSALYEANAFLQVRNPDSAGNYPPVGEFWNLYGLWFPENTPPIWPVADPGEPEGANLASPFNAFVHGVNDMPAEEGRLFFPVWLYGRPPANDEERWELGKIQRGTISFITGEQSCPALEGARMVQMLNYTNLRSMHGKAYGGFFPTPTVLLAACGATEATGLLDESLEIKFTATRADAPTAGYHGAVSNVGGYPVVTYAGSCPLNTDSLDVGHVLGVYTHEEAIYVAVYNGIGWDIDIFPTVDWVEGPYTGEGKLSRYDGGHISRALDAFLNDFRGSPAQRAADKFNIRKIAFSFKEFHERQYFLAPQRGAQLGAGLSPIYPAARLQRSGKVDAGEALTFDVEGHTDYQFNTGYVCVGWFAKATNLAKPVTLELLDGNTVFAVVTLSPDSPTSLTYLTETLFPSPLKVRLATPAEFTADGVITIEFTELVSFKPTKWDAYFLLRLSATQGGDGSTFVDGRGIEQAAANEIYHRYLTAGCITNEHAAGINSPGAEVNTNPIYDAGRRLALEHARFIGHQAFRAYAVENGKSVFWFNRWAFGQKNNKADHWHGIAPSYVPATEVQEGIVYVVRAHGGGRVWYEGTPYAHNQRFTGFADKKTFTTEGDAQLFEYEGIRPTAPKKGYSNEHLLSIETKVYHPAHTSTWSETYFAHFQNNNRCLFKGYAFDNGLLRHVSLSGTLDPLLEPIAPVAPSGYNYALGANQNGSVTPEFCASCQIYTQPYEIESATVEFDPNGDDIVKIVLKTRLRSHPDAPASLSQDVLSWDAATLSNIHTTQTYRTDDNALCEFSLLQNKGEHGTWKIGDAAANSNVAGDPDNPFASIIPTFITTRLVRKVYEDGNERHDLHDSRVLIEELRTCERKLKAWCESAVDGLATVSNVCGGAQKPYDYKYENLCKEAFGGRAIFGPGYVLGPLVNTPITATDFNRTAACVDLLHTFRLEGLMQFQTRNYDYAGEFEVAPTWGSGQCPPGPNMAAVYEGPAGSPPLVSTSGWGLSSGFIAEAGARLFQCAPSGSAPNMTLSVSRRDVEFRYATIAGYENALPDYIEDLITAGHTGVVGTATRYWQIPARQTTTNFDEAGCGLITNGAFWLGSEGWRFDPITNTEDLGCMILTNGFVAGGQAPGGVFKICCATNYAADEHSNSSLQTFSFEKLGDANIGLIVVPVV